MSEPQYVDVFIAVRVEISDPVGVSAEGLAPDQFGRERNRLGSMLGEPGNLIAQALTEDLVMRYRDPDRPWHAVSSTAIYEDVDPKEPLRVIPRHHWIPPRDEPDSDAE